LRVLAISDLGLCCRDSFILLGQGYSRLSRTENSVSSVNSSSRFEFRMKLLPHLISNDRQKHQNRTSCLTSAIAVRQHPLPASALVSLRS
jgi:hypothetical protein